MTKVIEIKMAEMLVGKGDLVIKTSSIGSCLVIILYDKVNRIGGMVHAMLPNKPILKISEQEEDINAKYVDSAVTKMLKEVITIGAVKSNLRARIIGGAKMFNILDSNNLSIGQENVLAAKNILNVLGIPIQSEDTGGSIGRLASLNLNNGVVEVSTRM